jgi:large subunit ribosomal protein L24
MQKVRKEDNVLVMKGKDRGRVGPVRKVLPPGNKTDKWGRPQDGRVIVTGVNIVKRHMRPRGPQQPGGIVERESPISWANVAHICPSCQKPTRTGFRGIAEDRKVRYCKRCNANID